MRIAGGRATRKSSLPEEVAMWDETCNSGDWGEVLSPQVPCGCDPSNHEKYDEEVGSSQYGPYWEQGVRCLRCGRKWADPEVEERRRREWLAKQASEFWAARAGCT